MEDCVFCKIIKSDIKVDFVYQDDNYVVFDSNAPVAEYHMLVVPKKHIANFMEMDESILSMAKIAQKMITDKNILDGYKLIFNGGKYQEVPHVHWHILAGKLKDKGDILDHV